MEPCSSVERLIAREADAAVLAADERRALEAHLVACAACRSSLDAQRQVARALHARPEAAVRPGFAARLSSRLDEDNKKNEGILGLANWRAWTVGLAPLAAALVMAAWIGVGARTSASTQTATRETTTSNETASPFESWTASAAGSSTASVFLQPTASGDVLLETVLTGSVPATASEGRDVR